MLSDLDEFKKPDLPEYDLCIVGSGPAGMTVAHELKEAGLRICVLESGKLKPTPHGDNLRAVRSKGIRIKEYSRERVLGGASTTWSGLSSPLDPVEMNERTFLQVPGWPISRATLLPYYQAAADRYRFPPLSLFDPEALAAIKAKGDLKPDWRKVEEKTFMAPVEPQHFGREFEQIFEVPGIDGYLDATLTQLRRDPVQPSIACGEVRTSSGGLFQIKAKTFVLATGGIENARILLNSQDLCPQGLGNENDQVGRYMMNHPKNYYGTIQLNRPVQDLSYFFGSLYQGFAGYAGLRLGEALQADQHCLNSYVRFEPLFPWSDNKGVEALVFLAKQSKFILKSWKHRKKDQVVPLRDYAETGDDSDLQNERKSTLEWLRLFYWIMINTPQVVQYLYFRLLKKTGPRIRTVRLRNFMEMEPDPENRVVLGKELDVYGQPIPIVKHQCSTLDRRSLEKLHTVLMKETTRNGLGKLTTDLQREDPWPIDLDASHHMGTTRMGDDPANSVVNRDCRLHSIENVYLTGGSVFSTCGCANPTFTIVALAIRLAEHLSRNVFDSQNRKKSPLQDE